MGKLEAAEEAQQLFQRAADFARELLEENAALRKQMGKVEKETRKFAERYAVIAEQSDLLQNLFVVTHKLHATLDPDEVLMTIKEILLNLLGCEKFTLWIVDDARGGQLTSLGQEGFDQQRELTANELELSHEAMKGEAWFAPTPLQPGTTIAVVPLKVAERPRGLMVIHGLLKHKEALNDSDRQVLELISGQGAVALITAQLYSKMNR